MSDHNVKSTSDWYGSEACAESKRLHLEDRVESSRPKVDMFRQILDIAEAMSPSMSSHSRELLMVLVEKYKPIKLWGHRVVVVDGVENTGWFENAEQ